MTIPRCIPRYKAGPVEYWIAGAITEFMNGCIDGLGGSAVGGAGVGGMIGGTALGHNVSGENALLLSIASAASAMIGHGVKQVVIWHKSNPFPNPWPAPTGNTNPPIPPQP